MSVPVSDPEFWNSEPIRSHLGATLGFLSDDRWDFAFSQAAPYICQLPLDLHKEHLWANPDSVVLFSGGADSLCATVEAISQQDRRPILVSHRSAPNIDKRQQALVQELRRHFPQWQFPHISVWIHRIGKEAADTSQRTRAFLFASLGVMVASQLGLLHIFLADNGIVSLNLPINA